MSCGSDSCSNTLTLNFGSLLSSARRALNRCGYERMPLTLTCIFVSSVGVLQKAQFFDRLRQLYNILEQLGDVVGCFFLHCDLGQLQIAGLEHDVVFLDLRFLICRQCVRLQHLSRADKLGRIDHVLGPLPSLQHLDDLLLVNSPHVGTAARFQCVPGDLVPSLKATPDFFLDLIEHCLDSRLSVCQLCQ